VLGPLVAKTTSGTRKNSQERIMVEVGEFGGEKIKFKKDLMERKVKRLERGPNKVKTSLTSKGVPPHFIKK